MKTNLEAQKECETVHSYTGLATHGIHTEERAKVGNPPVREQTIPTY
jgi:hypothetical protein